MTLLSSSASNRLDRLLLNFKDGLLPALAYPLFQLASVKVEALAPFAEGDLPATDLGVQSGNREVEEGSGLFDVEDGFCFRLGVLRCQQPLHVAYFFMQQADGMGQLLEGEVFHGSFLFGLCCNGRGLFGWAARRLSCYLPASY